MAPPTPPTTPPMMDLDLLERPEDVFEEDP